MVKTLNIQKEISEINNLISILTKYCENNIKIEEIEIMYTLLKIISDKVDFLYYFTNNSSKN